MPICATPIFAGAKLCSYNNHSHAGCADFRGADLHGANLRGVLICHDGHDCRPVDAATLRSGSRSNLDGAILQ